ncbi:GntR family transcriptional regulator [Phenylobacterium sp. LjRoot225]|uniref:FadR/GntR family transcriptional regulator n=1 Tax=Phenylobacterium sp. LjRoot225 TaxID=3342285 RepID=UPI003ED17515
MSTKPVRSTIDAAAAKLRAMSLAGEPGALLGSEDHLVAALGVSRATVRQVARLLEREGLLRVRRGLNGGYFVARPGLSTIEAAVSAYLDTLDMDAQDVTVIASVLWVEVLRKAASVRTDAARAMAAKFRKRVAALKADVRFGQIAELEQESRTEIFALTKSPYIELIFQINMAFAQKHFSPSSLQDDTEEHREFVDAWRKAKLMELDAIFDGDPELGMMAARHIRNLWHQRIWARSGGERPARSAPLADLPAA